MTSYLRILLPIFIQLCISFLATRIRRHASMQLMEAALSYNLDWRRLRKLYCSFENIQIQKAPPWKVKSLIRTTELVKYASLQKKTIRLKHSVKPGGKRTTGG